MSRRRIRTSKGELTMEIKIFTDAIDALEKLAKAVIAVKDIPQKTRKGYEEAVSDAFTLMDSALMLVYNRLGDLLLAEDREEFLTELAALDNVKEWAKIEREVRLCRNLRATRREMGSFVSGIMGQVSVQDWRNMRQLIDEILEREGELADFISKALKKLAQGAPRARTSARGYQSIRRTVSRTKDAVQKERRRLIASELQFLDSLKPT
jgi:hypothetical protein